MIYHTPDSKTCMFWYKAGSFSQSFYSSFILHFYIIFTGKGRIFEKLFAMAHTLNMKVIAEGVESFEQLEFLRSLQWKPVQTFKCYGAQGFYFSKPVPAEVFTDFLRKQNEDAKYNEATGS